MTTETPTTPFFPLSYPDAFPFSSPCSLPLNPEDSASPYLIGSLNRFDRTLSGKDTKIAFICAFGSVTLKNDLVTFLKTYNLPNADISFHYPLGVPSYHTPSWTAESSLCSQWISAFCPDAEIFGVFSPSDNIFDLIACAVYACDVLHADVICMSFGCIEFMGQKELCSLICKASERSIFVSASGNSANNVFFPSTCAHVVSVGKCCIRAIPQSFSSVGIEYASKDSSSGFSRYAKIPFHQQLMRNGNTDCYFRSCPDFCMRLPSNVYPAIFVSGKGFIKANGTSLCCALASCMFSYLLEKNPMSFDGKSSILRYLYTLAGGKNYNVSQHYFTDIKLGSDAVIGFDTSTGLGAVNCHAVCNG